VRRAGMWRRYFVFVGDRKGASLYALSMVVGESVEYILASSPRRSNPPTFLSTTQRSASSRTVYSSPALSHVHY
jgi:hypothetical protein